MMDNAHTYEKLTTRQYLEGDEKEIVELLRAAFPSWAKMSDPIEYWRWKYRRSPLETHIAVSTVNEKIVGVAHCIKMKVKLGSRVLVSYYDDDYATNPENRKKGMYKALTNYTDAIKKETKADFCYWITRNPIVLTKAMIHEQVTFPTPFSDLLRVRDIDSFIEKYQIKNASLLKTNFLLNKPQPIVNKKYSTSRNDFTLVDVDAFDDKFETFWDNVADDYDYFLQRNRDYMNWRFTQNPSAKYRIKAAISDDRVIGYIVLEITNDDGYVVGTIFDLLTLRDRADIVHTLLEEAVKYLDSLNVNYISLTTMQGNLYQEIADSLGFINNPDAAEAHVMFWGYNEYFYDTISGLKPEKIYFSYSDYY
jgi:hypothetical protein